MIDEGGRAREVLGALTSVIDPELGIDIVSLGLVYRITVEGDDVGIVMTLTVPGCPMHETITSDVLARVQTIAWVRDAIVDLTFDPPWTVDRLSAAARAALAQ